MSKKKIALVTGADSGLGREFVRKLLEEDVEEIWAVARNKEKLEKLIYDYGKRIKIFPLDLTVRENFAHLQERLAGEGDISIRFLVNNAGFAKFCSYYDIGVEESLNMMDLNMGAVVALALVCIPYMEAGSHIAGSVFSSALSEYIQFHESLCAKLYKSAECGIKRQEDSCDCRMSGVDKHRTVRARHDRGKKGNDGFFRDDRAGCSCQQGAERY